MYCNVLTKVCVAERPAYLSPALSDIEDQTAALLARVELEQSMLNDHELRHK